MGAWDNSTTPRSSAASRSVSRNRDDTATGQAVRRQRSSSRDSRASSRGGDSDNGGGGGGGRMRSQSPAGGGGGGGAARGPGLHAALQSARRELVLRDQDLARAKEEAVMERRSRKQQVAASKLELQDVTQDLVSFPCHFHL